MTTIFPSHWPAILMVLFLVITLFTSKRTTWIRYRKNTLLTLKILAVILLPIQALFFSNLFAFHCGIWNFSEEANIAPHETHVSPQISNWFTTTDLPLGISSNGSVTLILVDQNRPDIRVEQGNYSEGSTIIRLPYLHTWPFIPASWTLHFYNPNSSQIVHVDYYIIPPPPNGPPGVLEWYIYTIPFVMFLSFVVCLGTASKLVNQTGTDKTRDLLSIFTLFLSILFAYMIFNVEFGIVFTGMVLINSPFIFIVLLIAVFVSAMRSIQDETTSSNKNAS
ncbi:MAG: hypothetical protein ACW960_01725 [Candidatus Thorarchaeota archaeon]|jgi:hypothetical protein